MCQKFWSNNKVSISGLTILVKIFGGLHQCAKMLKKSKEIFMIIRGVIHKKTVLLLSGWLGVGGRGVNPLVSKCENVKPYFGLIVDF